ncbi:MAG: molybdopterin converting factor subunit 1 [Thiotrichaceae bacterium]
MITLLYFASIREALGCEKETLELPESISVNSLITQLRARNKNWENILDSRTELLIAVNQQMSDHEAIIHQGDEVAFFPPVTGG